DQFDRPVRPRRDTIRDQELAVAREDDARIRHARKRRPELAVDGCLSRRVETDDLDSADGSSHLLTLSCELAVEGGDRPPPFGRDYALHSTGDVIGGSSPLNGRVSAMVGAVATAAHPAHPARNARLVCIRSRSGCAGVWRTS